MGLLRLAVFGPPEVFHDERRLSFALHKAEALLLYLAVEGGMHSRSKLAALLWPDSESSTARNALRNALALLRSLLAGASAAGHSHLLQEQELLGLNTQAPLERDLDVVQRAWKAAQGLATVSSEEQRAALVATVQHALSLVRGPFLDGFWLREETAFDEWHEQQQQQWQVRVQLLLERLSSWQEEGFELEPAKTTLTRWLSLEPLSEEASRRLMRVHLTQGDLTAAVQVYATLRARLAEELRVKPSAETAALAERIRATKARRGVAPAQPSPTVESRPPGELVAPLVGRAAAFRQLVGRYQQARQGQPQAVLLVGEAGIGKTRLASEFVTWAWAQRAEVLRGHAIELGGRLPYQPLVEALREGLEAENAPEDLLEDLWLAELSRLLPELRLRYPDLPAPTQDELSGKLRLFEAVARLLEALAQRAPVVLLLEDLHWVDGASLDLLRYLGHAWKGQNSRVLLLGTVRSEELELNPELYAQLLDLGRDLPLTQLPLPPLSQTETFELLEALATEEEHAMGWPSHVGASSASERPMVVLGNVLFARTGGQPLYLLETLKLLRERQWLLPHLTAEGVFRLAPAEELVAALAQPESRRELLPPSVRAMIQTRLFRLSSPARQLVMAGAVLGSTTSAKLLWLLAGLPVPEGVEALEEAIKSSILREEEAGVGRPASYGFSHDLVRDVVYTELGAARRLVLHQHALAMLEIEGAPAAELAYHALSAGEVEVAYRYSVKAGEEALAVFAVEEAIGHYEQARALLKAQPSLQSRLSASEVEHLYVRLGQAYAFLNAWTSAQQIYEELLAYAQQHQLPVLVIMTLNRLAILAVQQGKDESKVQALLEQAWQQAQSSSDQRTLAETAWNWTQIISIRWEEPKRALPHGEQMLELARAIPDQELQARSLGILGWIHILGGDFEEAIHQLEAALELYSRLSNEPLASPELSLPAFTSGAPLTQPLTNRATEALCWAILSFAQMNAGQVQRSLASSYRALALSQESKNVWTQVASMPYLTYGLLEAGEYEEALGLIQDAVALARTFPLTFFFLRPLTALGSVYQALQQWEEARAALQETVAVAERFDLGLMRVPALSRLCLHSAVAGEWEAASRYALQAIAWRKHIDVALIGWDFSSHYETEALLHAGEERQAREEVQRLGERLGSNRRFRIPYLRSLALLVDWDGHGSQAITHLREAAALAEEIGLPEEQWQIQARLATVYEAAGEPAQARLAWTKASTSIQGLAQAIKDETLRARFLAGPQIQPVLQHAQCETSPVPQDHAEQNGL
jgi:DNA-binding SARP family transcriptional activator/tetratricopeptide (TPR) repeat protein